MLGEKLWVDLAVPTGNKIWDKGIPALGREGGLERAVLPWQGVLATGDAVEC